MHPFVIFALLLLDVLRLPFSAVGRLFARKPSQYISSVYVEAPLQAVWDVSTARDITLDGWPPLTLRTVDIPTLTGGMVVYLDIFDQSLEMGLREIERWECDSVLYEVLPAYTSPEVIMGTDVYVAFGVEAERLGTRLTATYRLFDKGIWNRVSVPLGLRLQLRRIKKHVERRI